MKPGDVFTVEPWPFVLEDYNEPLDDEDARGVHAVKSWRPGVRHELVHYDGQAVADGLGTMLVKVIDVHRLPHPYPARVFFTRQWRDPDGNVFGKRRLLIRSVGEFTKMLRGYRDLHDVSLPEMEEA